MADDPPTIARFTALVTRLRPQLRAYACRQLGNEGEDAVQEACLHAWEAICQERMGWEHPEHWLWIILCNQIHDMRRRAQRAKRRPPRQGRHYGSSRSPHSDLLEARERVVQTLHRIPLAYRSTMQRFAEGALIREIARDDHCPINTVGGRLWRARRALATYHPSVGAH